MSYESLLGFIQEARDLDAQEASKVPVSCPIDTTLLQQVEGGVLHCSWCSWQYPKDA